MNTIISKFFWAFLVCLSYSAWVLAANVEQSGSRQNNVLLLVDDSHHERSQPQPFAFPWPVINENPNSKRKAPPSESESQSAKRKKVSAPGSNAEQPNHGASEKAKKKTEGRSKGVLVTWRCPDCYKVIEKDSLEHMAHSQHCAKRADEQHEDDIISPRSVGRPAQSKPKKNTQADLVASTTDSARGKTTINKNLIPIIIDITKVPVSIGCEMEDGEQLCQEVFSSKDELLEHIRKAHILTCSWPDCGDGPFENTTALLKHIKKWHGIDH